MQSYEYVLEQDDIVRRSAFDANALSDDMLAEEPEDDAIEDPYVGLAEMDGLAIFLTGPEVRPHI